MNERSLPKRLWYGWLQILCRQFGVLLFGVRCRRRAAVPATGGALLLSTHQSHLDPVLIGLAVDRRLNYVARETLFRFWPFRWLIESLDAIPIDREGMGLGGLKETLKRLKRGEVVLIFPEGTRTSDGQVAPLKPGFSALAKRARVPLVPVAIVGAFAAWPRWRRFPARSTVQIHFGEPLLPEDYEQLDDRALVAAVEAQLRACHAQATADLLRRGRAQTPADCGAPGG